jgi:putative endonuclease
MEQFTASYGSASCRKVCNFTYVYVLQGESKPAHFYSGCTDNLRKRLARHNAGKVAHTAKWRPWHIKTYIGFFNSKRAAEFARYLKSASGRAFLKKHL